MGELFYNILTTYGHYESLILEFIGITIIVMGTIEALLMLHKQGYHFGSNRVKIHLGEALALALEFKMGAEIIHTVTASSFQDIYMLAFIAVIRIILAFVIHWEVKEAAKEADIEERIIEG